HILGDAAIENVVAVPNLFRGDSPGGLEDDRRQPITVVPFVFDVLASGDPRFADAVPLRIVLIGVRPVGKREIVRAGLVAGARAVSVLVVFVGFVGLVVVVRGGQLRRGIV